MEKIRIAIATDDDRATIYRLRHDVYARELQQHHENERGEIRDALDDANVYIAAKCGAEIAGFISITPLFAGVYSIEKYLRREEMPLDENTFEIRILTVIPARRASIVAALLMYASLRWVEAQGGTRVVAIGRREVRDMYVGAGFEVCSRSFQSGAVDFALMMATPNAIRDHISRHLLARMESAANWDFVIPFHKPAECFHGGAFFNAIGDEFDRLDRRASIINADVLDAWFSPSPRVIDALREHLPWLVRTSPPTGCEGMIRAIARARGVDAKSVLVGAGSSSLIFLAFREWLDRSSRVLLPDPTYGEYAHVLEKVVRCRVDRLPLDRANRYRIELPQDVSGYDLIVLVNPNSPTGQYIARGELEAFLRRVPATTLVWIDETYIDYLGAHETLEPFAASRPNVVICKSMSKVYALSGMRCAYLCASPHLLERLRGITPPWAVGLPAQVAAVAALGDDRYYAARYRETHALREELQNEFAPLMNVVPGSANFLLCHVDDAEPLVTRCREYGLFIRHIADDTIRIAVKDRATNERMAEILGEALGRPVAAQLDRVVLRTAR
jgi:histidinol-phosphate/aromatic aminotransferase/cobyric acid decarboxylase-like protein/predicted GNAT family N-acyltransferase